LLSPGHGAQDSSSHCVKAAMEALEIVLEFGSRKLKRDLALLANVVGALMMFMVETSEDIAAWERYHLSSRTLRSRTAYGLCHAIGSYGLRRMLA